MNIKFPEIQTMAIVSSKHISEEDNDKLELAGQGMLNNIHFPVVHKYEYGYFIHISTEEDNQVYEGLSTQLLQMIQNAKEQGMQFLRVDQDGPEIKELEIFDW